MDAVGLLTYQKSVNDPGRPLDLGFLRWVKETYNLGFRFFYVVDSHPHPPVLVQCNRGIVDGRGRHVDLGEVSRGGEEFMLLVHQVGDATNQTFSRLVSQGLGK